MLGEKRIGRERVMVTVGIVAAVVGLTLMGLVISYGHGPALIRLGRVVEYGCDLGGCGRVPGSLRTPRGLDQGRCGCSSRDLGCVRESLGVPKASVDLLQ